MSDAFFTDLEVYFNGRADTIKQDLNLPEGDIYIDAVYQDLYEVYRKQTASYYSAGKPVDDMRIPFGNCLNMLDKYKNHPDSNKIFFIGEVDEYMNALNLLTWGLTLSIEQAQFERLVAHIDAEGKRDALLDLLIAKRIPNRPLTQMLYFPKLYNPLYEAIIQQPANTKAIGSFLSGWYQTCLKKTSTHDIHKLGDNSSFSGYWAWEVAGLTYALDIDDSSYQDMAYYPKDLVAFARQ